MTILLDCGWDIHFDTTLLEPLRSVVKRVDLVLISHPDLEHLGVSWWLCPPARENPRCSGVQQCIMYDIRSV